jgi:hypothetical protein
MNRITFVAQPVFRGSCQLSKLNRTRQRFYPLATPPKNPDIDDRSGDLQPIEPVFWP